MNERLSLLLFSDLVNSLLCSSRLNFNFPLGGHCSAILAYRVAVLMRFHSESYFFTCDLCFLSVNFCDLFMLALKKLIMLGIQSGHSLPSVRGHFLELFLQQIFSHPFSPPKGKEICFLCFFLEFLLLGCWTS